MHTISLRGERGRDYIPAFLMMFLRVPFGTSFDECLPIVNDSPVMGLNQISWFAPCLEMKHPASISRLVNSDCFMMSKNFNLDAKVTILLLIHKCNHKKLFANYQ